MTSLSSSSPTSSSADTESAPWLLRNAAVFSAEAPKVETVSTEVLAAAELFASTAILPAKLHGQQMDARYPLRPPWAPAFRDVREMGVLSAHELAGLVAVKALLLHFAKDFRLELSRLEEAILAQQNSIAS